MGRILEAVMQLQLLHEVSWYWSIRDTVEVEYNTLCIVECRSSDIGNIEAPIASNHRPTTFTEIGHNSGLGVKSRY